MAQSEVVLSLVGVTRRYPGVKALWMEPEERLDFTRGCVHALAGQNGAGKSTLVNLIAGIQRPSSGKMLLDGKPYAPATAAEARARGVDIVLQEPALIDTMTVEENLLLGRERSFAPFGVFIPPARRRLAAAALAPLPVKPELNANAGRLSLEQRKLIELARALSENPRILVMDEVTASVSESGVQQIRELLRRFASEGRLVIYISHHLDEIFESCDRVTILKDGRIVKTLNARATNRKELELLMVGEEIATRSERQAASSERVVLSVDRLSLKGKFDNVSFAVRRGQVVGLGGLMDSGADALAQTMFGALQPTGGSLTLDGRKVRFRDPNDAIAHGVAFVPSDRDREGLILASPIAKNMVLAALAKIALRVVNWATGFIDPGRGNRVARDLIQRLRIRSRGPGDLPLNLSGGNRQKVVLAKWLLRDNKLLVLHNPTRGVDVGGYSDIHALIGELADKGAAVVVISDSLSELIQLSDEILIMRRGVISGRFTRQDRPSEKQLIDYMV